ncbi:hypothetical protein SAMN04489722_10351 [Algibacter lectus]|uniref:hypothetical protein n=1 Tax=Algibacter lectus TaxID=221126 RepID=UPI0008EAE7BD|nr:hypothetical protein [Algibacter lectus]SFC64143.1 hypothetical protein SAMN04489722_10351 [Algibacter lectus]
MKFLTKKLNLRISAFSLLYALLFFNIAIPKGGFKIGDIPITWGYILLILFTPLFLVFYLKAKKKSVKAIVIYLGTLFFAIYSLLFFSLGEGAQLGKLISFLSSVIVLPLFFLVFCSSTFQNLYDTKWDEFISFINKIILFISIYGIALFLYRNITGEWFTIPGITVNLQDPNLDWKYNNRGVFRKLISTYNNGNIYGLCLVLLLPFTEFFDNKKIRYVAMFSLLLTLSRTVWIGAILYMVLLINKKTLLKIIGLMPFLILAIIFLVNNVLGFDVSSFLISKNLGGRMGLITSIDTTLFYNTEAPFIGIGEIVYASIVNYFGLFGLVLFLVHLFSPILVNYGNKNRDFKILRKSILLYGILAVADGAFNYIPVMFIFWFIAGLTTINFNKQLVKESV